MTERKWTPGPWDVYGPNNHPNKNMGFWRVEGVSNVANDITFYDAHLISAALDLYEALSEIDQWSRSQNIALPSSAIYAALAKARGEQ